MVEESGFVIVAPKFPIDKHLMEVDAVDENKGV